jgi:hypothetical protein
VFTGFCGVSQALRKSLPYLFHAPALLIAGGGITAFEKEIGPMEQVQAEWHKHVRRIKSALDSKDIKFFRDGELPALAE